MAGHVFISYNHTDATYAYTLAQELKRQDLEPWIDNRIRVGKRWWKTVVDKLRESAAVIVVMTPESEESEWVEREVHLALRWKIPVFPLKLRGEGFPLLVTTQHIDVTDEQIPEQSFFDELRKALGSQSTATSQSPRSVRGVNSRSTNAEIPRRTSLVRQVDSAKTTIGRYVFPNELYYDQEHLWIRVEGDVATVGLSDFGQDSAGEIVYVEIPVLGRLLAKDDAFMSIESGLWIGRIKSPVSGKITAVNEILEWESNTINDDPYGKGWLVKIELNDPDELSDLHRADSDKYAALIAAQVEKYDK